MGNSDTQYKLKPGRVSIWDLQPEKLDELKKLRQDPKLSNPQRAQMLGICMSSYYAGVKRLAELAAADAVKTTN